MQLLRKKVPSRCKSCIWYVVLSSSIIISCTILIRSLRWHDTQRTSITRVHITRARHLRYGQIFCVILRPLDAGTWWIKISLHGCNGIWSALTLIALHVHATMADACRFTRPDRRWLRRLREWNYDTLVFSRIAYIRIYSERTITIVSRWRVSPDSWDIALVIRGRITVVGRPIEILGPACGCACAWCLNTDDDASTLRSLVSLGWEHRTMLLEHKKENPKTKR